MVQQEQRTIITLVEQQERQENPLTQTEQLLRCMTGSITAYINEVGMKPLRMSDYDKAVLAIRDGEMAAFTEYFIKVPDQADALLVEAADQPGLVGRNMTAMLLNGRTDVDYTSYCAACKKAININDPEEDINGMTEEEKSLDGTRVKALFFALYFGADLSVPKDYQMFTDCFVTYEERTRTVNVKNEAGVEVEKKEKYTVAVPITDLNTVYQNIASAMAVTITDDQKANADSVYNLVRYGTSTGAGLGSTDAPFIGVDGFCSLVGSNWRNIVTSEFGYRKDPFTGKSKGHGGIDLGIPIGTSVRAALPGRVAVAQYSSSYGYYVMIDHGGGLATLYAHNSKLLVKVGQTVQAGDIVSLSSSTGPHLHFEVRVNGERTNPRSYLP